MYRKFDVTVIFFCMVYFWSKLNTELELFFKETLVFVGKEKQECNLESVAKKSTAWSRSISKTSWNHFGKPMCKINRELYQYIFQEFPDPIFNLDFFFAILKKLLSNNSLSQLPIFLEKIDSIALKHTHASNGQFEGGCT
jgi:hypothetical protein